ncbi:hypothetical protein [Cytobacillus firmus]|uniref:hypothetical protein n=1 Tax=Cytobacillus firmus TaxID=1399 RepID=UPI0018CDD05D|nr:hypothetical protein [Cytobacillus firmus]MBG9657071.1 hypothetical protein [Cytobacillus firmus]MED1906744.1 hypothetical protein [Cytobacillus firmus]
MKEYGIYAFAQVPDKRKTRRVFSVYDTIGEDRNILREKMHKALGEHEPVEISVPSYIRNVNSYFNRWDQSMFYQQIRKFQNDLVSLKENHNETGQMIKRDDFIAYNGDIDTLIPVFGNMLFIDEKESIDAIRENQTSIYFSLAKACNQHVWYLVGPAPTKDNPMQKDTEYKLCEITPDGEFNWFKGSFADVMQYLYYWLEKSYDAPLVSDISSNKRAKHLRLVADNEAKFKNLANEVEYLQQQSKYHNAA